MRERPEPHNEYSTDTAADRRGGNDRSHESVSLIVEKLGRRRDLDRVIRHYERGDTYVRDAAGFTQGERTYMMNFGRQAIGRGRHEIAVQNPDELNRIVEKTRNTFKWVMNDTSGIIHPVAGYNFAVNASGFRDAGHRWALNLDQDLGEWLHTNGSGIDSLIQRGYQADGRIRQLLAGYTNDNPVDMTWYLAERSQMSENHQRDRFEREMAQSKRHASKFMRSMADAYGLPKEHLRRSLKQLKLTDFSAFDFLLGGVTVHDGGSRGDYIGNTLRVEVKMEGSPSAAWHPSNPLPTLNHEVFHATSAQDSKGYVGLRTEGDHGRSPNEALTELFNRLSLGQVVVKDNARPLFPASASYLPNIRTAYELMRTKPETFKTLYYAYYGHIPSKGRLKHALRTYYDKFDYYDRRVRENPRRYVYFEH